jgi:CheY-like chemotaxis protein
MLNFAAGIKADSVTAMGGTANAVGKHLVMVVDDDDDIRETLAGLLEDEGYSVVAYPSGQDALDALRRGIGPRVILLDLMMPVMDGAEFRREQLADPTLADIPVVLITAAGLERVSRSEYSEVLRKPLKIDRVLDVIAGFC